MELETLVKGIETLGENQAAFVKTFGSRLAAVESEIDDRAKAAGRQGMGSTAAPADQEHRKAFSGWLRRGDDSELRGIQSSLSTSSDPDGGFLVPETLDREMDRVAGESVAMRQIATVKQISEGDYKKPLSLGGAAGGWVGEMEARDVTDGPELAMFAPPWVEMYHMPEVSQKLLDLAGFDVEAWLMDEITTGEIEKEGAGFISGNSVKQPKGILAYTTVADQNWEHGKLGFIASGSNSAITADNLIDLQSAAKPVYRADGVWLMADSTWAYIRKLKDGNGDYLWRPGLEPDAPDVLLGKQVYIDDNMPAVAQNAFPVAFGDFRRGYLIGDWAGGRRLVRDQYTRKGWVKLYVTKRLFGGVSNHQAIKLLKVAA
ncbi:phage major capsid protein [Desulfurivibrio sp. D14AmB]|uniref:phage major capsid protein n=1 Tax=Desulfurivibrio sp. D14AmB TaxID=3374370 RepID=UPI00376EE1E7